MPGKDRPGIFYGTTTFEKGFHEVACCGKHSDNKGEPHPTPRRRENLMKERKETPVQNVVSQENIDLLIEKYYQEQKEKEDKS